MSQILMVIMAVGAAAGGIDRILGNKYGYGEKFEEGFMFLGPTALSMAGMVCIAPVLSNILGKVIIPFYQMIGVDSGMFGSFLAIDMGGYQMAKGLEINPQIGSYAGIVAAAIFGCTVVFIIPVGMGMVDEKDRPAFAKGIMLGIVTMPVGLFVGGVLCGLSVWECFHLNLPTFLLAIFLFIGLWKVPVKMIRIFCAFANVIRIIITFGLILGAVEYMCGFNPIKGMAPISEAMEAVSGIGIVMLGSLPAAEFLQRMLKKPFQMLGKRIGINSVGMAGLLVGMVSAIPAISMVKDMDGCGKVANAAFLVSGASLFAAHVGFTLSAEPELLGALVGAKLSGAAAAFLLAIFLENREKACNCA